MKCGLCSAEVREQPKITAEGKCSVALLYSALADEETVHRARFCYTLCIKDSSVFLFVIGPLFSAG